MSTPCPNCSGSAFGTDAVSICTECVSAAVAGVPLNLPLLIAASLAAGAGAVLAGKLLSVAGARIRSKRVGFA